MNPISDTTPPRPLGRLGFTLIWCSLGASGGIVLLVRWLFCTRHDRFDFWSRDFDWLMIGLVLLVMHLAGAVLSKQWRRDLGGVALIVATFAGCVGADRLNQPPDENELRATFQLHRTELDRVRDMWVEDHAGGVEEWIPSNDALRAGLSRERCAEYQRLFRAIGVFSLRADSAGEEVFFVFWHSAGSALDYDSADGLCWRRKPAPATWCEERPDREGQYWSLGGGWYACQKHGPHPSELG